MATHGTVNTRPTEDEPDKLPVIVMINTHNLIGLQQYLLSSVRVSDKLKMLETYDASAGLCSEVHMVPKNHPQPLHGSGRVHNRVTLAACR